VGRRPGPHAGQQAPVALLCVGLLAVAGGTGGLLLEGGHRGTSPRPPAQPARAPAGTVGAPARPAAAAAVGRPAYLSIPAIGVHTRLIRLGLTPAGTLQVPANTSVAGGELNHRRWGRAGLAFPGLSPIPGTCPMALAGTGPNSSASCQLVPSDRSAGNQLHF
jgi:hypothetical protein